MRDKQFSQLLVMPAILLGLLIFAAHDARAHCDTMDGPVVKAAQRALAKRNVNLVLIWVQQKDEAEIKRRFRETLAVRGLSSEARQLADNYFFETLVRVHRAGEGEPYTGVKPAGTDLGPVIPAADKAIANNSLDALLRLFPAHEQAEIRSGFAEVISRKSFDENDVSAGREYVKAYIHFMHHVEHVYESTKRKT